MHQTGQAAYTVREALLEEDEAPHTRLCVDVRVCACLSDLFVGLNKCIDSIITLVLLFVRILQH